MGLLRVDYQWFLLWQIVVCLFIGDQVSNRGSLTGGFYDHRRTKLKNVKIIKQCADSIHISEENLKQVKFKIQDIL
jgi:structural maintenance of chromosome 3 (chondroitin sulfate proteoglycan 6)